jgi:hypothetical protein
VVEKSHVTYRHEATDTVMLFAVHKPDESVKSADRATVRRMLDERGLLPAYEFERRTNSARGPQPTTRHPSVG